MWPKEHKDWLDSTQSLLTCIGIVVAGCLYFSNEEGAMRLNISQTAQVSKLTDYLKLVSLKVSLTNPGKIPVKLKERGYINVKNVAPLPDELIEVALENGDLVDPESSRIQFPRLRPTIYFPENVEVGSGETQTFLFDFTISATQTCLRTDVNIPGSKQNKHGWQDRHLIQVAESEKGDAEVTLAVQK